MPASPTEEYKRRIQIHEARGAELKARHISLGYLRLFLIAAFLIAVWLSVFQWHRLRWLGGVPAAVFIAVAVLHARVLRSRGVAERSVEIYRRGIARIEDRWAGMNARDVPMDGPPNLYAADLDIVGQDGLFELLCTARTRMGEETLLRWLLAPATPVEIRERQQSVEALRDCLDFRERMAVAGNAGRTGPGSKSVLDWAEAPDVLRQRWWPWLAGLLAAMAVTAVSVWMGKGIFAPLFFVLVIEAAARLPLKREMAAVLDGTEPMLHVMQLVAALVKQIEAEEFHVEHLRAIRDKLFSHTVAASVALERLASLGRYRDSLDNPIVRVLNLSLMYSVQLAFAVQRWRRKHGGAVRLWLEALGEMEALLSLAAYSYEHPQDPFPQISEGDACFEAVEIGHPLLPASRCVRNDVRIGGETRVLLISGSNMSGKSTLMRTVGVNTVLAMCGAPVRASSLRLTPMRIGASLQIKDSLHKGQSRFYAEIERLSQICTLAEQTSRPGSPFGVLFLIDELLQGTNSKDRLIGAQGIIGALVRAGAVGMVTTHDLTLTSLEGLERGALKNMHFQEHIVEGQMRFDFRMREGIVATSNGAELMRLMGLKV